MPEGWYMYSIANIDREKFSSMGISKEKGTPEELPALSDMNHGTPCLKPLLTALDALFLVDAPPSA